MASSPLIPTWITKYFFGGGVAWPLKTLKIDLSPLLGVLQWRQNAVKTYLLGAIERSFPLYIQRHNWDVVRECSNQVLKSFHANWFGIFINYLIYFVGLAHPFVPDTLKSPHTLTWVLPLDDEPLSKKGKMKHHSKKEKPRTLDPLNANPLYLVDETNVVVVTYKSSIPFSLYKDGELFCRITTILATRWYKPPIFC